MQHDTAIPMDRAELAVVETAAELVANRSYASADSLAAEAVALSKQLRIRAGAAGTADGALFPVRAADLAVLERIRDELRLPARIPEHPAARILPQLTDLLRRLYERIGAAATMTVNGIEVITTNT